MREIKFRAWNKKTEQYVDFEELGVGVNSLAIKYIAPSGRVLYLEHGNSIVLEQYTGLKDKNGVEIYEGDILTIKSKYNKTKKVISFGEWTSNCGCCNHDLGFGYDFSDFDDHSADEKWEIIGNIHENGELLK